MRRTRIAAARELSDGQTLAFEFTRNGKKIEAFLARFRGRLLAYENRCRHLPLRLDCGDGRLFSRDGEHFVCQNHAALYDPLTGLCVRGPCEGARLKPLKIESIDGEVMLIEPV